MTIAELEQRLVAVERELAELKMELKQKQKRGWESTFGIFANDPVFDEVVRQGREWREQVNRETMP